MKFGYKDSYDRHEVTFKEFHENIAGIERMWDNHQIPVNEYQALMETLPHQHAAMSEQEREADWLTFQERIEAANLTERETIVVNCIVFGGMSLAQTGIILAQAEGRNKAFDKMTVSRSRDTAYAKLRKAFQPEQDHDASEEENN